jgi:hypothetical protein
LKLNPLACIQDIEKLAAGAEQLISEVKAGDTNISDYISQVEAILSLATQTKTDCSTTQKIEFNPQQCISDITTLSATLSKV